MYIWYVHLICIFDMYIWYVYIHICIWIIYVYLYIVDGVCTLKEGESTFAWIYTFIFPTLETKIPINHGWCVFFRIVSVVSFWSILEFAPSQVPFFILLAILAGVISTLAPFFTVWKLVWFEAMLNSGPKFFGSWRWTEVSDFKLLPLVVCWFFRCWRLYNRS